MTRSYEYPIDDALTDEIAKLRGAFLSAVPAALDDHRFGEMMGSPWSVLEYVTEHFNAQKETLMKTVQAVDYQGSYAYSRGSVPAVINLANVNSAVLIPPDYTRNVLDNITRLHFNDGSHLDVFGAPADFVEQTP